jgi:transposase
MLIKTAVCDWYNSFKSGQELLEDELRSRPSTCVNAERISKVKELVHADQQITINEVVNEVGISCGSAQAILTEELQMRWDETRWTLLPDSAPSHMATTVQQFLAGKQIALMPEPPYASHLAPCDFWLFPRIKMGLLGQGFVTLEDVKCKATAGLRTCQWRLSMSASRHGKTVGASLCVRRRTVLRGCLDWKALRFKYLSFTTEFRELFERSGIYTVGRCGVF